MLLLIQYFINGIYGYMILLCQFLQGNAVFVLFPYLLVALFIERARSGILPPRLFGMQTAP